MTYAGSKEVKLTKCFLKKKIKEGALFIFEKYLDKLPWDWIDCIIFIKYNGIDQNSDAFVLTLDDKSSEDFFSTLNKEQIELFVYSDETRDGMKLCWNCLLAKEKIEGEKDLKPLFIGAENLRKFCDKRNIFYKSSLTSDGKLISGSNFRFQKNPGEDCLIPLTAPK